MNPPLNLAESATWQLYFLTEDEVEGKLAALQEHRTQFQSNVRFLRRFVRTNELINDFPAVHLRPDVVVILDIEDEDVPSSIPEELTEAEREIFVEAEAESVRVPLELLDGPERLLVTARSYQESVPLDWDPWRIVELKER